MIMHDRYTVIKLISLNPASSLKGIRHVSLESETSEHIADRRLFQFPCIRVNDTFC